MLARGWLAYPVTPIHSLLPPKSGCICQHIPRFALSRLRATALFRNPVYKAQRSVPGFSSTPTSACRRYATSPPSAVAYIIGLRIVIEKIAPPGAMYHKKNAEERFHMLARGWLAYPVTPIHSLLPPKSGCRSHIPRLANNLSNRSSAVAYIIKKTPSSTHCANYPFLISPTTTYLFFQQKH